MPARELANAPRPRGHPVAALSGSMVYARILAIGGHLGKSPHFYVAHPSLSLVLTNTWYVTASQSHAEAITASARRPRLPKTHKTSAIRDRVALRGEPLGLISIS